jgi:hypothetical protein
MVATQYTLWYQKYKEAEYMLKTNPEMEATNVHIWLFEVALLGKFIIEGKHVDILSVKAARLFMLKKRMCSNI